MEFWKDIEDYEGLYQVSNCGKIRNLKRNFKILKNKKCSKGKYLQIGLSYKRIIKYFLVHRLVAKAFILNPNNLPEVNHIDGNTFNNNDWNLEWCTRSYNIIHSFKIGIRRPTILTRENCHLSKLNSFQIKEIINLRQQGIKFKDIAYKYNMSISGIEKIIYKK